MTLEQLRLFVAVAEREHLTNAAKALNLTQSAVSAAISTLESYYAVKLFDRVGRGIVLTDAGRIFLHEAKAVLSRVGVAERVLTDIADMKRGALVLAASQTIANYWLPSRIHHYHAKYPGITLDLAIDNTAGVARRVLDGACDVGLVEGTVEDPLLFATPFAKDELVLVVPPNHPWANGAGNVEADLARGPWIVREPGSGTRAVFEAIMAGFGLDMAQMTVGLELPSNEAVCSAVEAGVGVTVLSRLVVANALQAGRLVAVSCGLPSRQFFILRHKDHTATRAQTAFLEMLKTLGGEEG